MNKMIFVYDLETTGLDTETCDIIERYFHELTHDSEVSNGLIKIDYNLQPEITEITKITNKMLNDDGQSYDTFYYEMLNIFDNCHEPTLIAHNGNSFDHKILRNKKIIEQNNVIYLDSKVLIYQITNNVDFYSTLSVMYKNIMSHDYNGQAHRARTDVMMLLDIFKKLNIDEKFLLKINK